MTPIDRVADLVASRGMDRAMAAQVAYYVAERSGRLSIATAHSSSRSALRHDPFLVGQLGLTPTQISAWLALLRGTRTVQRNGRTYGGRRGYVEACLRGSIGARERDRFSRLARIAATGSPEADDSQSCTLQPLRSYVAQTSPLTTPSPLDQSGHGSINSDGSPRAAAGAVQPRYERGGVHRPHGGAAAR